eukprot:10300018-Alexandrium_andersonii.AAC.1
MPEVSGSQAARPRRWQHGLGKENGNPFGGTQETGPFLETGELHYGSEGVGAARRKVGDAN